MAVTAIAFEQTVADDVSHVAEIERKLDEILSDRQRAKLVLVPNGDKPMNRISVNVFVEISDEEMEDLKQLYVEQGWRNVKIRRPISVGGVHPGFVFEADFA